MCVWLYLQFFSECSRRAIGNILQARGESCMKGKQNGWLGGVTLGRRTCDLAVVGSIPGLAATHAFHPSGVGKSSTGPAGWGYGWARSLVSGGR